MTQQHYSLESFTTGHRQTVQATDWATALDNAPGDCFTVVRMPDGRYMAGSNKNRAFPVAGGHYADTAEAAADSIRSHYSAIQSAST